jgi:hypothetical protein
MILIVIMPSIFIFIPSSVHASTTTLTVTGEGGGVGTYTGGAINFTNMQSDDGLGTTLVHSSSGGVHIWDLSTLLPVTSIISVTVNSKCTATTSGNQIWGAVNIGGVDYLTAPQFLTSGGVFQTYQFTWTTNPATGIAWTVSNINDAYFGTSVSPSAGAVWQTYITVDVVFTPPTSPDLSTSSTTSIGGTAATLNGTITSTNGDDVRSEGFVWDTSSHTPLASTNVTPGNGYANWWYQNGTYGVGALSHAVTGLTIGTTYYYRACANNTYGWNYGSELSFKTIGIPSVSIQPATSIATTSAQLNSLVVYDGEQACDVRFGYGTTSQPATAVGFNAYDTRTAWVNDTYITDNTPYVAPITLALATTYYYNVQIENDAGISYGVEGTFTTSSGISAPTNFAAIPNSNSVTLVWTKGVGSATTYIRYSPSIYPNTTVDGTLLYSGTLASYTQTNLTAGTTYYYSAWGASGGLYSSTKATAMGTTTAGAVIANIPVPTVTGSKWVMMPSELGLVNFPFYTFGNWIADTYSMPRATFWLACYMLLVIGVCMFIYMKAPSNNLLLTGMAGVMFLGFGTLLSPPLIPIWAAFAFLIVMITIGWVVNRY